MIALRDYQAAAVERIRASFRAGHRRVLFVLPTGGGKTIVFSYLCGSAAARAKRVAILAHRAELVEQISAALSRIGVAHGIVAAGFPETNEPVQVCSIASLVRRLDRIEPFDLVVVDEAHHAVAGTWRAVLDRWPDAFVLGVSATPERADGRGLGDVFTEMVIGPSCAELTEAGFLVPATVYAPAILPDLSKVRTRAGDFATNDLSAVMASAVLTGDVIEHYERLARGVPAVGFCVDIAHSQSVAARFREAGFRAAHVDGMTPKDERRRLIAGLGTGEIEVLTNASLVSEGVDIPVIGACLLLRPTMSLSLHLQQVGRALRPAPGKARAIVLDHAGNTARHGFPDDPRVWTLDSKPRRGRGDDKSAIRRCEECGAANRPSATTCAVCGETLQKTAVEIAEAAAELVELSRISLATQLKAMPYAEAIRWADTEQKLRQMAKARGYHHKWVRHQLHERGGPAPASYR